MTTLTRPGTGRIALAYVAGVVLGLAVLVPGWTTPLDLLPDGQFGVAVGIAAIGLLVFTLVLWLVVVVFVVK